MPSGTPLKKAITVPVGGRDAPIRTAREALRWIDETIGDDPAWIRTRRALTEAEATGALRRVRAATRAFEEAVRRSGYVPP